jgi:hypothetical protein
MWWATYGHPLSSSKGEVVVGDACPALLWVGDGGGGR